MYLLRTIKFRILMSIGMLLTIVGRLIVRRTLTKQLHIRNKNFLARAANLRHRNATGPYGKQRPKGKTK